MMRQDHGGTSNGLHGPFWTRLDSVSGRRGLGDDEFAHNGVAPAGPISGATKDGCGVLEHNARFVGPGGVGNGATRSTWVGPVQRVIDFSRSRAQFEFGAMVDRSFAHGK